MPNPAMRVYFLLCLLIFSSTTYAQVASTTPPAQTGPPFIYHRDYKVILEKALDRGSELYYHKLIIRFLNNDSSLTNAETLALLIGFTENPQYKPVELMEKELEIYDQSKANEFQEVVNLARPYLQKNPVSMLALREIAIAYNRLGNKDSSRYFASLNDKIMEAMIYSSKGKKPLEPIFALGLADGEYFVQNVGFYMDKKNTDWNKQGDFMEIIDTYNDQDVKTTFYFAIQHAKLKLEDDQPDAMDQKRDKKSKKKEKEKESKKKKQAAATTAPPAGN